MGLSATPRSRDITMGKDDMSFMAFAQDFVVGGTFGAISKTLTAPIERVKLVIQTQDANPRIMSGEVPRYTGIGNCFTRILSEQGMASFWRGNLTNVIRYFPTQAFNLAFKDTIKKMFPKYSPKEDFWKFFAVNLASGGLSDCIVKTAKGPAGVLGLYNGFGVSVAGIIAYRGVQFGTFDTIMGLNPYKSDKGLMGMLSTFVSAQTAVLCSAFFTYPFDTVRRRLQMQSEKPPEQRLYRGTIHCTQKIMADEGVGALFKGFVANAFRTVGAALVLVLYDKTKQMLDL